MYTSYRYFVALPLLGRVVNIIVECVHVYALCKFVEVQGKRVAG